MDSFVIDTNVLIVANGKYINASDDDVYACGRFLDDIQKTEKQLSIDSTGFIFKEYFKHTCRSGQPGIGDKFAKWFWQNQGNTSICEQVDITPDTEGDRGFLEFPADESLKKFDHEDRKFVAVAKKSKFDAVICNASDSDWWDFKDAFERAGIKIKFLCPELTQKKI